MAITYIFVKNENISYNKQKNKKKIVLILNEQTRGGPEWPQFGI